MLVNIGSVWCLLGVVSVMSVMFVVLFFCAWFIFVFLLSMVTIGMSIRAVVRVAIILVGLFCSSVSLVRVVVSAGFVALLLSCRSLWGRLFWL